ncbi:MAG: PEP-CTERM sorting domain-containing protein [Phycisphaeraceae bacterium]|nr:PEP-CTERM sorting domain-containing protein [Phycisphaeraceae bacterium]
MPRFTLKIALPFAALIVTGVTSSTSADVLFTGSGWNPEVSSNASGTASFSVSGSSLIVVLTNTTSNRTTAQGNALTGVVFDVVNGGPNLVLSGIALAPGSEIWTSKTASNTTGALAGSWTSVLGSQPLAGYGAATTGFAGAFHGGSITLGNSSPNYGIVANNTFDGTSVPFGGAQFPFIQNSLVLTFSGASGLNEMQIGNVRLLFGTDGTGMIDTQTIPAPGALALLALAAGLTVTRRRR